VSLSAIGWPWLTPCVAKDEKNPFSTDPRLDATTYSVTPNGSNTPHPDNARYRFILDHGSRFAHGPFDGGPPAMCLRCATRAAVLCGRQWLHIRRTTLSGSSKSFFTSRDIRRSKGRRRATWHGAYRRLRATRKWTQRAAGRNAFTARATVCISIFWPFMLERSADSGTDQRQQLVVSRRGFALTDDTVGPEPSSAFFSSSR
jgi:hypothetical protein